jgi:hypothetical protein
MYKIPTKRRTSISIKDDKVERVKECFALLCDWMGIDFDFVYNVCYNADFLLRIDLNNSEYKFALIDICNHISFEDDDVIVEACLHECLHVLVEQYARLAITSSDEKMEPELIKREEEFVVRMSAILKEKACEICSQE